MWAGIAGSTVDNGTGYEVALSIHDSVYNTDFASDTIPCDLTKPEQLAADIEKHVLAQLTNFGNEHICKFVGAGVAAALLKDVSQITRFCLEIELMGLPIVFNIKTYHVDSPAKTSRNASGINTPLHGAGAQAQAPAFTGAQVQAKLPVDRTLDEQADSAARKCIMYFGPSGAPRLTIGARNAVSVDAGGKIHLLDDLEDYKKTVGAGTWNAITKLADELKERKVKMGFFSSTPQGGGVALMRHALIRFFATLGVDCTWYVPNPSPSVFRTTKNNHNILQGVAAPSLRLTQEAKDQFDAWILKNGLRWVAPGGPLAEGGVDIAFIDDPQMPGLIPLIKKHRPNLPIIYRSHIEIRSDLVHIKGSPQEEVWNYLWNNIQHADMFISHPVSKFVPSDVPLEKLSLLGAATDMLDGLNKHLNDWDTAFYMGEFRTLCAKEKMHELKWPQLEYFVQIARFDPSKGIPNVIDSYVKYRHLLEADPDREEDDYAQLLICGNSAIDDPDATIIYDETMKQIHSHEVRKYAKVLNALMANSRAALQLSTREGFEVKVSEGLHAGRPVIASRTGGIPLQIEHGLSGYLTEPGDNKAVAKAMYDLFTDDALQRKMSEYAASHVSDEVGTVGNAAAWMYLAVMYTRPGAQKLKPNGAWLNDMLREETGQPYLPGEPRLPRTHLNMQG
ncbi:hypothetical protein HWV62_30105 [Athelia sp. TMB]|nr:hypothetical protein HWV62_30105 [Athelia sp. TMB]